ncbi:uncharacterized protein, partial [Choristoneura fumiferana]|uniref:uncharacterized protein n=1 Tax=Choristoneura fumiferana TaxID=7141 RepID=UPI003D159937
MNLSLCCVLLACLLTPYLHADPSPDSIQIQNYDGPIFLQAVQPNCCPLCNSLLTQQPVNPEPCDEIPEEYLRNTPGTNDRPFPNITPFGTGPSNAYIPTTSVNQFGTDPEKAYVRSAENTHSGTMLHKNGGKAPGITYSVPLTLNTL